MTKQVVIVGDGMASQNLLDGLLGDKGLSVTVVCGRAYRDIPWQAPVCFMDPSAHAGVTSEDPSKFEKKGCKYVYGVADGLKGHTLSVAPLSGSADGKAVTVDFDYLVVATGFACPNVVPEPGQTLGDVRGWQRQVHEASKKAANILVTGGGAVGIEVAGMLATITKPGAKVTLATHSTTLLPECGVAARSRALAGLEAAGVEVLTGCGATNMGATAVLERTNVELSGGHGARDFDVYLPSFSTGPRTAFLKGVANMLDARGAVDVDGTLRSKADPAVFAIGACSNSVDKTSNMPTVGDQAKHISAGIKALARGAAVKQYAGSAMSKLLYVKITPTYGFWVEENLPAPVKAILGACGFPCNALCPCFCMAATFGPCNFQVCGSCCGAAEGIGVAKLCMFAPQMVAKDQFGAPGGYVHTAAPRGSAMARS